MQQLSCISEQTGRLPRFQRGWVNNSQDELNKDFSSKVFFIPDITDKWSYEIKQEYPCLVAGNTRLDWEVKQMNKDFSVEGDGKWVHVSAKDILMESSWSQAQPWGDSIFLEHSSLVWGDIECDANYCWSIDYGWIVPSHPKKINKTSYRRIVLNYITQHGFLVVEEMVVTLIVLTLEEGSNGHGWFVWNSFPYAAF